MARPTVVAVRALLIANADDADPGYVGARLRHHGYAFTDCPRERPDDWPQLDGHDLVLILGSEWSVYWPTNAVPVAAEAALIRAAHGRGVPMFGICFGSQMLAHALGGSVQPARAPEIGWFDVVTDEPRNVAGGPWLQWHADVVTLPAAATELARSDAGPQAWRIGSTFATQFHPEATETMLDRWTASGGDELARNGLSRESMMTATRANIDRSRQNADRLVDWFCEHVC
jgi:GMP synthase-like glutamine amidotransferase